MSIRESGEMYLENILLLSRRQPNVRAIDIVNMTGYSKPSISRALGVLKKDGMLVVDDLGSVKLTPKGEEYALKIYERHKLLTDFFERIGVPAATAEADACRIEHVISNETVDKIRDFMGGR